MFKHMEDDGDLNMIISTTGTLLIVCSKCKEIWTGKLTLAESPTSAKVRSMAEFRTSTRRPTSTRRSTLIFRTAPEIHPSLLKEMNRIGIDPESFTNLRG